MMRERILYFIISCVFAIVTTSSVAPSTSQPIFRETTTDRIFEDNQKNSQKNYTIFTLKRVEMENKITSKEDILWPSVLLKAESFSIPEIKTEPLDKIIRLRPSYTILSRYKERVLRN